MRFITLMTIIFASLILVSGCVTQKNGDLMKQDIIALKTQVENIQQTLAETSRENQQKQQEIMEKLTQYTKTSQLKQASGSVEFDRIKRDMRMLTGIIEKNDFNNQQEMLKMQKLLKDSETKVSILEAKLGIESPEKKNNKKKQKQKDGKKAKPAVTVDDKNDADTFYKKSKELIVKEENTVEGRRLLAIFLRRFPKDKRADNAQYWIGETYYREKNYHQAVMEFQKVTDKYPKGDSADDAYYMLGQSFKMLGMKEDAKLFYEDCIERFPKSNSAKKSRQAIKKLGK